MKITLPETLLIATIILIMQGTALALFSYTLDPVPDPPVIYTGESIKIQFSIKSTNYLYDGKCSYKLDDGSLSNEYVISPGATQTMSTYVQAPPEGSHSGSAKHTIYTYCYESAYSGDPTKVIRNASFILSYDDSSYEARVAINSAQDAINSAESIINNTLSTINESKSIEADLAENELADAIKLLKSANTRLSFADSFFTSSDYNQSIT
ncbi:MAG TPA: hypothetical protein VIO11_01970, partial [Candidatus Methanoperedens sp.]